jgi:hypothetical protein
MLPEISLSKFALLGSHELGASVINQRRPWCKTEGCIPIMAAIVMAMVYACAELDH